MMIYQDYEEWKREDWDRAHRERDITALTGTGLNSHLFTLGAVELASPDIALLCVGVGVGTWVQDAAARFRQVWALDVSREAAAVMPETVNFLSDARELPSDRFDLAMSLWVAPHMTDRDLELQMREVVRSLKPAGVFALHYKEPLDQEDAIDNREGAEDEWRRAAAAGILRRRRHMAAMIGWCGGTVLKIAAEYKSQFLRVNEVSIHIGKKEV